MVKKLRVLILPTYQLKSCTYLSPTAMDVEMAFLMANQALATLGKLLYGTVSFRLLQKPNSAKCKVQS
ncbi:hypothetical protein CFP56_030850 [Quercus suber]|uniref:Uncharacterized protein n=1 Tax=Quercus suber TaxID=58331 RepID=A0AAW0JM69_QUESU